MKARRDEDDAIGYYRSENDEGKTLIIGSRSFARFEAKKRQ
jgi:hypothetical protein